MTDRELDAAVAEKVMGEPMPTLDPNIAEEKGPSRIGLWRLGTTGYEHGDDPIWEAPSYSTDHNAVAKVRERIAELKGIEIAMFLEELWGQMEENDPQLTGGYRRYWATLNATPRQQCKAALAAVGAQP